MPAALGVRSLVPFPVGADARHPVREGATRHRQGLTLAHNLLEQAGIRGWVIGAGLGAMACWSRTTTSALSGRRPGGSNCRLVCSWIPPCAPARPAEVPGGMAWLRLLAPEGLPDDVDAIDRMDEDEVRYSRQGWARRARRYGPVRDGSCHQPQACGRRSAV